MHVLISHLLYFTQTFFCCCCSSGEQQNCTLLELRSTIFFLMKLIPFVTMQQSCRMYTLLYRNWCGNRVTVIRWITTEGEAHTKHRAHSLKALFILDFLTFRVTADCWGPAKVTRGKFNILGLGYLLALLIECPNNVLPGLAFSLKRSLGGNSLVHVYSGNSESGTFSSSPFSTVYTERRGRTLPERKASFPSPNEIQAFQQICRQGNTLYPIFVFHLLASKHMHAPLGPRTCVWLLSLTLTHTHTHTQPQINGTCERILFILMRKILG